MKPIAQLSVLFAIAGMAFTAPGQTTNIILQTDFDGDAGQGNYSDSYGYCVAGSSAGSVLAGFNGGLTSGVGVDGSYANAISPDYTLLPSDPNWTSPSLGYVYALVGNGTQFGGQMTPITPTAVLSSFILSADLQVTGLLPGLTTADVTISKVQFQDSANNVLFDFTGDAGYVGSNFVHLSVPLSDLSYGGANGGDATHPVSDFTNAAVVSSIANFTIEFAVEGLPVGVIGGTGANLISPPFGFTSTGSLVVDNIELIQTGNTIPTPMVEKLIWQADFDSTFPNGGVYDFSYRDGSPAASGSLSTNLTGGVGGSASLEYTVDLSSWSGSAPTSYSGFGVGAVETPLAFTLTSSSKASYRVYLSAKVGGTSAGVTSVPGVADLLFYVPAGTLTPANAQPAVVFDLNPTMVFSNTWQSYEFDGSAMPIGVNNGGSQALFNQYVSKVNQMQVQVDPQGSPDLGAVFGYDNNNTVDIDNIKVVELVPGLGPLTVIQNNGRTQVTWADPTTGGTAKLQSATNVAGPYLDVAGASSAAASPYAVPPGSGQQFFRTVWVP